MQSFSYRLKRGFTLIETMVVIAILAIVLAMTLYNQSRNLTRSTFNQDMEMFTATLKEAGTTAKKLGMINIEGETNSERIAPTQKKDDESNIMTNKYCLWVLKEKMSPDAKAPTYIRNSGIICKRGLVNIQTTQTFQEEKKKKVNMGVWIDLYEMDTPDVVLGGVLGETQTQLKDGNIKARIIFQPNSLPRKAGSISIALEEGSKDVNDVRWQRIDIERSGVITVNTVDREGRLDKATQDEKVINSN